MWKRILLVTAFVGLMGVLLGGAVFRTMDRTGQVVEAQGRGHGRGLGEASQGSGTGYGQGTGGPGSQDREGGSRGQGRGNSSAESGLYGGGKAEIREYGSGGQGRGNSWGAQANTEQAHSEEWVTLKGVVTVVDEDTLLAQVDDSAQVTVEGRTWRYAQEEGFWAEPGDEVTFTGFYEEQELKVGRIDNVTSEQSVLVRDDNGRPMWAGRGWYGD